MKPLREGSKIAAIWRALRRRTGLTAAEAFSLGDTALAGTIFQLKRRGYRVADRWETSRSRYGAAVKFKRYFAQK